MKVEDLLVFGETVYTRSGSLLGASGNPEVWVDLASSIDLEDLQCLWEALKQKGVALPETMGAEFSFDKENPKPKLKAIHMPQGTGLEINLDGWAPSLVGDVSDPFQLPDDRAQALVQETLLALEQAWQEYSEREGEAERLILTQLKQAMNGTFVVKSDWGSDEDIWDCSVFFEDREIMYAWDMVKKLFPELYRNHYEEKLTSCQSDLLRTSEVSED